MMTNELPKGWKLLKEDGHDHYISPCETVHLFDRPADPGRVYERIGLVDEALRKLRR